jgi:hypothetical protein
MCRRKVFGTWRERSHHSADLRQRLAGFLYAWQSNTLGATLSSWRRYARCGSARALPAQRRPAA